MWTLSWSSSFASSSFKTLRLSEADERWPLTAHHRTRLGLTATHRSRHARPERQYANGPHASPSVVFFLAFVCCSPFVASFVASLKWTEGAALTPTLDGALEK